jgi:hypothetical protein
LTILSAPCNHLNKKTLFIGKGVVSVILLNGDERIPRDAIVAENYVPAVADESMLLTVGA